jgi:hypothetical protein
MSTGTEDFEKLRNLMKLKRHEQPPPGYFNGFSTRVLNRLEREGRPGVWDRLGDMFLWLRAGLGLWEKNPVGAGVFGVGFCGLVVSGIALSQYLDRPYEGAMVPANLTATIGDSHFFTQTAQSESEGFGRSMSPTMFTNDPGSLFATPTGAMPVNYSVPH